MDRVWMLMHEIRARSWLLEKKRAWCSVDLGSALSMHGVIVTLEGEGDFLQSPACADCRWLDVPLCYQVRKLSVPESLSRDMVLSASAEAIRRSLPGLRNALAEENSSLIDGNWFAPAVWEGHSLALPIDFIRIYGLSSSRDTNGERFLQCHVQLGEHLCVFRQTIDRVTGQLRSSYGSLGDNIRDPVLTSVLQQMIQIDCADELNRLESEICFSSSTFFRGQEPDPSQVPVPREFR